MSLLQAELQKKAVEEEYPKFFGFFQKLLKENSSGLFVGKDVSSYLPCVAFRGQDVSSYLPCVALRGQDVSIVISPVWHYMAKT